MMKKLLWIALAAALPLAAALGARIAPDLKPQGAKEIDVIVQFTTVPSDQQHQKIAGKGGKLKARLGQLRSAVYTIRADAVAGIAALPEVTYVSCDRRLRGQLDYSVAAVNADLAWHYGWSGSGVGIAIIDSGIAGNADLENEGGGRSRVVYSESFGNLDGTQDLNGHGTHVAGIAAGDGHMSGGHYRGIAPRANLINLRVLGPDGEGSDSAVIAAIARAIEIKDLYGIRVLNLSLGRPVFESYRQDPLCQAVEAAWKAGIVVVVAAGNNGRDNSAGTQGYAAITAPGNDPYVITVGAMKAMNTLGRADDLIASYSSKGPTAIDHIVKPDLVAPGNQVVSLSGDVGNTLSATYPDNIVQGGYFRLSGTSMAAPVVSAAAALLLEQDASLTPDQIKARLMKTAGKDFPVASVATDPETGSAYTSSYDLFTVGAGYVDINAALHDTDLASRPALSPAATYDPETHAVFLVQDGSLIWESSPAWSLSQIWRLSLLPGDSDVSATSVVWGAGAVEGCSVVWGSSAMSRENHDEGGGRTFILGEK